MNEFLKIEKKNKILSSPKVPSYQKLSSQVKNCDL